MTKLGPAIPAALAVLLAGCAVRAGPVTELDLTRPEGTRQVLLAHPAHDRGGLRPLVILLHGHTGSAQQVFGKGIGQAPLSVWRDIADREGVVVAAPQGVDGADGEPGWNDCRGDATTNPKTDDVGLLRDLIAHEVSEDRVDPDRVFVMGMSNGAMMSYRAAIELGDQLAGFAAVSGNMAADSQCPVPSHPLSALVISGTADPLVPYGGGAVGFGGKGGRGTVIGAEAGADLWRRLDGLNAKASASQAPLHRLKNDPTSVFETVWGGDPAGLQVMLVRIQGGGHVEPSESERYSPLYLRFVGPQNGDVETAELAWAFFRDKRRHQEVKP